MTTINEIVTTEPKQGEAMDACTRFSALACLAGCPMFLSSTNALERNQILKGPEVKELRGPQTSKFDETRLVCCQGARFATEIGAQIILNQVKRSSK